MRVHKDKKDNFNPYRGPKGLIYFHANCHAAYFLIFLTYCVLLKNLPRSYRAGSCALDFQTKIVLALNKKTESELELSVFHLPSAKIISL